MTDDLDLQRSSDVFSLINFTVIRPLLENRLVAVVIGKVT